MEAIPLGPVALSQKVLLNGTKLLHTAVYMLFKFFYAESVLQFD